MIMEQSHFALPKSDFVSLNLIWAQIKFWSNSIHVAGFGQLKINNLHFLNATEVYGTIPDYTAFYSSICKIINLSNKNSYIHTHTKCWGCIIVIWTGNYTRNLPPYMNKGKMIPGQKVHIFNWLNSLHYGQLNPNWRGNDPAHPLPHESWCT